MPSNITIDGVALSGSGTAMADIFMVVSGIIQAGATEYLFLEGDQQGVPTKTAFLITPTSKVSGVFQFEESNPLNTAMATNLDSLRDRYFSTKSSAAESSVGP